MVLPSVLWVIFGVVVDFVLPLYDPIGVNTSTCLSVVSVTILAKLDRCCDHEADWQECFGQWHIIDPSGECTGL